MHDVHPLTGMRLCSTSSFFPSACIGRITFLALCVTNCCDCALPFAKALSQCVTMRLPSSDIDEAGRQARQAIAFPRGQSYKCTNTHHTYILRTPLLCCCLAVYLHMQIESRKSLFSYDCCVVYKCRKEKAQQPSYSYIHINHAPSPHPT